MADSIRGATGDHRGDRIQRENADRSDQKHRGIDEPQRPYR